jgi:hypothetical protein
VLRNKTEEKKEKKKKEKENAMTIYIDKISTITIILRFASKIFSLFCVVKNSVRYINVFELFTPNAVSMK